MTFLMSRTGVRQVNRRKLIGTAYANTQTQTQTHTHTHGINLNKS